MHFHFLDVEACWQLLQSSPPEYWPLEWGPPVWNHENGRILQCKSKKIWIFKTQGQPVFQLLLRRLIKNFRYLRGRTKQAACSRPEVLKFQRLRRRHFGAPMHYHWKFWSFVGVVSALIIVFVQNN